MSLALMAVWVGTFAPEPAVKACPECTKPTIAAHAGSVRVLTPSDNTPPATGEVVLTNPLLGLVLHGKVEQGRVAIAWFDYDSRDSANGVIVLPAGTEPRFVEPAKADALAIQQALMRNEVLSGVRRALAGMEIGAIDTDGDGKADYAVTYGCNAWADGACQSHGQFFLARRGTKWIEIE